MSKLWQFIGIVLLITVGIFSAPTWVNYLKSKSVERGSIPDLEINEYVEVKDNYTITYHLDGGSADNPTEYNLFTETFNLNAPTKQGYDFIGWTNETLTEPTLTVTISQGSAGDVEFTANYEQIIGIPEVSISTTSYPDILVEWQPVEDADYYFVYLNDTPCALYISDTSYLYRSQAVTTGLNSFKVVASKMGETQRVYGAFSNSVEITLLDKPQVVIDDNNTATWNAVPNATSYVVKFANGQIETTATTISIYDYESMFSDEYAQSISVYAVADGATSMPGSAGFNYDGAIIDTTINVPYTLHIEYLACDSNDKYVTDSGDIYDRKVAEITIWFEKDGVTYTHTETVVDDSGYICVPMLNTNISTINEYLSFDGCEFIEYSSVHLFSHFAWYIDSHYYNYGNSEFTLDLGYRTDYHELFEVTTSERTGMPAHLIFNCVIDVMGTIENN